MRCSRSAGLILGMLSTLAVVLPPIGFAQAAVQAQDTAALLAEANRSLNAGEVAKGETALSRYVLLQPNDLRATTLLAKVENRLGDQARSITLFRKIVAAEPNSAEAHLNLAIALADTTGRAEAISEAGKAIVLDPKNPRAYLNRARMLDDQGKHEAAAADFRRAEVLAPHDPEVKFFYALSEQAARHWQNAARLLQDVVVQQPDNAPAFLHLAQALIQLGESDEATRALRRAVQIDPASKEAAFALYQQLRVNNDPRSPAALEHFNQLRSAEEQTERAKMLGNEAYGDMQRQQWAAAQDALQSAIAACGECRIKADLHQRLGLAECHAGDLIHGEQELRTALRLRPDDPQTLRALQWIAEQKTKER